MNQDLKTKTKVIRMILFSLVVLLIIASTIYLFPRVLELQHVEKREELRVYIESIGFWGWLLAVGMQVLQVVVAFLPGEPFEIIIGMVFGPIGGMLTCMLGIIIGTIIIYLLGKTIGIRFVSLFVDPDKISQYRFINNSQKKDVLVFTLFFIPGTPKDILTYFVPFIKMPLFRFIIISTFARTPSIISSTLLGDSLGSGKWALSIIIFVVTLLIAIIGILINRWYMKKHQNNADELNEHM